MEENRNAIFGPMMNGNVVSSRLDDGIPQEICPLPSLGKVYPDGHPLCGKSDIGVRVMTAREEDILTNRALIKKGKVLTELLKSCIIDKSVDVNSLLVGDQNAIMLVLRMSGYGADYGPIEIECENCGHKNTDHHFDLRAIPLKTLDVDPVEAFQNKFSFQLPMSKKTVHFRLSTGADEERLSEMLESNKKLGEMASKSMTTRLTHQIVQVDDITGKNEISLFVQKMLAGDSRALRNYVAEITPGVNFEQTYVCPNCEDERLVEVPITRHFFWS